MRNRLEVKFAPSFSRDLKKLNRKKAYNLQDLENVIDIVIDNSKESLEILKTRHNMHRLSGKWAGSNECHVANAGDWLVIWRVDNNIAYFQRTGTHDELFR
jgi:mRNA interferase YafQ